MKKAENIPYQLVTQLVSATERELFGAGSKRGNE